MKVRKSLAGSELNRLCMTGNKNKIRVGRENSEEQVLR